MLRGEKSRKNNRIYSACSASHSGLERNEVVSGCNRLWWNITKTFI